jgi:hypothetical protein
LIVVTLRIETKIERASARAISTETFDRDGRQRRFRCDAVRAQLRGGAS